MEFSVGRATVYRVLNRAAELMGHSRLDTTRQYSLPTERDKADALNHLTTDH